MKHLSIRLPVTFLLFPCILCLYSCKKNRSEKNVHANNEVKATVVHTSGNTVTFNATWPKAKISQGTLGITTGMEATSETNERISIFFFSGQTNTITVALGKHPLGGCEYRINATQAYFNDFNIKDSVNITAVADRYLEGTFALKCKSIGLNPDSVIVAGSFKGSY